MATLREQMDNLETELSQQFGRLQEMDTDYEFFTEEDIENGEHDQTDWYEYWYEFRTDPGNVIDIFIQKIDKEGIHYIKADDSSERGTIQFTNLATIRDKVNVIENMEEFITRTQQPGYSIEIHKERAIVILNDDDSVLATITTDQKLNINKFWDVINAIDCEYNAINVTPTQFEYHGYNDVYELDVDITDEDGKTESHSFKLYISARYH